MLASKIMYFVICGVTTGRVVLRRNVFFTTALLLYVGVHFVIVFIMYLPVLPEAAFGL